MYVSFLVMFYFRQCRVLIVASIYWFLLLFFNISFVCCSMIYWPGANAISSVSVSLFIIFTICYFLKWLFFFIFGKIIIKTMKKGNHIIELFGSHHSKLNRCGIEICLLKTSTLLVLKLTKRKVKYLFNKKLSKNTLIKKKI